MDFTSELLARLQEGESVDSLAIELTKAINDAHAENERIKAEQEAKRKAEAEAKRQAEQLAQDKYDAIESLLCAVEKVIVAWDLGNDVLDFVGEIDTDELVQELDEAIPAAKAYAELMEKLGALREPRSAVNAELPQSKLTPKNDPIEDFLNKFVR